MVTVTLFYCIVLLTTSFRNKIRDPGVLYNSKALCDILNKWVNELTNICKEYQEECFSKLDKNISENMDDKILPYFELKSHELLFSQLYAAFGEISNVARLCVESGVFPKTFSYGNYEIQLINHDTSFENLCKNALIHLENHLENIIKQGKVDKDLASNVIKEPSPVQKENAEVTNLKVNSHYLDNLEKLENKSLQVTNKSQTSKNQNISISLEKNERPSALLESSKLRSDISKTFGKLENQDGAQLSFDRHSLSTVTSETGSSESTVVDHEGIHLKFAPVFCENANMACETCDQCEFDKRRALFVLRYYPVLIFSRIRSLLSWKGGCRWRTWNACLAHLQGK